jgi:phosphate transport system substrate-binding protein
MTAPSRRRVIIALVATASLFGKVKGDSELPAYRPTRGLAGTLTSVGSDTMNLEMTLWSEGFLRLYPNVRAEIEGKGSGTAPPALLAGKSQLAPMSRPMAAREVAEFKKKYGYPPTGLTASLDMLAVYVHKDNPIRGLTLPQLDAVFGRRRKAGLQRGVTTWGDLGLGGPWKDRPIVLYGRNSVSGTYAFFKEHVLLGGDYKGEVHEQPGSATVVQAVAADKYAIGYSGIGYKNADVRAVPLAKGPGSDFVPAQAAHASRGEYPLTRSLYLYVNYKPGTKLDPLRREFLCYAFSKQGQRDIAKAGYIPVSAKTAREALNSVGVAPAADSRVGPAAAPHPVKAAAGPTGRRPLQARAGFVLREDGGRWWVFRRGSKPLAAFDREGPPDRYVTRLRAAPYGVTLKAPDLATLEEYLAAEPGFVCKYEDGRLWIFRAGSKEWAEYRKNGELAKHVTRPRAGPRGLTLKSPDAATLEAYHKALGKK